MTARIVTDGFVYQLPFPPTVNTYWRSVGGRNILSKRGRAYRDAVMRRAYTWKRPNYTSRLRVTIMLYMPDKRRRDLDNYAKAPLDSLAKAGVFLDDEQIDDLRLIRMGVSKPGECNVRVEVIRE